MKCPKCWTEKVYRHDRRQWQTRLLACVSLVPMKCHHCYHKFYASWFALLGRPVQPPAATARKVRAS